MKQEIARPSIVRSRKTWLLCTVCALALGAGAGNPAYAGEGSGYPVTTNDPEIGVGAFGYTTLAVNPSNTSTTLSALIDEGGAGTVGAGTSVVTTANNFTASAGGNQVTNTISGTTLPLPNADLSGGGEGVVDGVAVLGNASNNATVATATVQGSAMVQSLAASVSAATVSSNTMAANVTLNQSTTTVQGQVPINYVADSGNYPESESASETFGNGDYIAVASVLATTVQMNTASGQLAGSAALVTGGNIGQTVTGADGTADVLNGSPAVIDNSLSANYVGNSATSGLTISAGGAPTFYGSAALTNLQQNSADSGEVETAAAHVTGSMIAFELQPGNPIIDEETETET
ncbi:MAG TPA: hypothetical protein VMB34_17020, partial [Acetobacteraceae bacterium]|nr:hypothetical protein [Acetobacteraceae bacterium]